MIHAPLRTFDFATELENLYHAVKILNYFAQKFKYCFVDVLIFNLLFIMTRAIAVHERT